MSADVRIESVWKMSSFSSLKPAPEIRIGQEFVVIAGGEAIEAGDLDNVYGPTPPAGQRSHSRRKALRRTHRDSSADSGRTWCSWITFGRKKKGRVSIMTAAREFSGALRWVMLPCLLSKLQEELGVGEHHGVGVLGCCLSWGAGGVVPGRGGTAPRCCARIVLNPSMVGGDRARGRSCGAQSRKTRQVAGERQCDLCESGIGVGSQLCQSQAGQRDSTRRDRRPCCPRV